MANSCNIKSRYALKNQEAGAMIIMAYLSILMFLFLSVLMLDVPYIERVGRSAQSAVDTAALAGAIQLTNRNSVVAGTSTPDFNKRASGWRRAKRAVFASLRNNAIAGAEGLTIDTNDPSEVSINDDGNPMTTDSGPIIKDPLDDSAYGYEIYFFGTGQPNAIVANIRITRGVYHRPTNPFSFPNQTTFYRTEPLPALFAFSTSAEATRWYHDTVTPGLSLIEQVRCKAFNSPDSPKHDTTHIYEPIECLSDPANLPSDILTDAGQPLVSVASSMQIELTIQNVPTLFAKLIGINYVTDIRRTATSVPQ
jgi:hypothetical protein